MTDLTGQNVRRFRSRDNDGGPRLPNDGRPATPRPIRRLNAPITQPFFVASASADSGSDEHVEDLIAGYALGALEPNEQLAVERHADYCPSCARLLAETRRTAAMLPFVTAPAGPSPEVKAALFARISQSSATVSAEQADEFGWARPVSPRNQATLPASGSWLESLPDSRASSTPRSLWSRRPRRSLGQIAGISLPVLLTFGLLAFFVVPQVLPSDEPGNPELAQLLSSDSTDCADSLAMTTSTSIDSACYFVGASRSSEGVTRWSLSVNNLVDNTPQDRYEVQVPTTDGTYSLAGTISINAQGQGTAPFTRPNNFGTGPLCLIEAGEDPNAVCIAAPMTPAA